VLRGMLVLLQKTVLGLFRDKLSLKTILILSFSVFILISVIFVYAITSWIYWRVDTKLLGDFSVETLAKNSNLLDFNLKQFDQMSQEIIANPNVIKMLTMEESNSYENARNFGEFNNDLSVIALRIQTPYLLNSTLRSKYNVYYTPSNVSFIGTEKDDTSIADYENAFYRQINANAGKVTFFKTDEYLFGVNDKEKSFAMGRLVNNLDGTKLGYMIIFIKYQLFDDLFNSASSSYGKNSNLGIFTHEGSVIYSNSDNTTDINTLESQYMKLPKGQNAKIIMYHGSAYLLSSYTSAYSGWTLINMTPMSYLTGWININRNLIIIFCAFFIVFSMVIAVYISGGITKPVKELIFTMRGISSGNLGLRAKIYKGSEMGELSCHFNSMIDKINMLIEENDMKQKDIIKAELSMLQAQINPHFLYNTLNSIRWLCIINKQEQIKGMIDNLSKLILNTFNKTDFAIPIRDELDILDCYVTLMKVRYSEFGFEVRIDEELKDYQILRFILQPFIENSILHGFSNIRYMGQIMVDFCRCSDCLKVTIADNGKGIPDDMKRKIILDGGDVLSRSKNIGIINVINRIRLNYGNGCNLKIYDNTPCGTVVEITLPLIR
jgi:two-component system, sensor histidine kinase YesM